jgi:serine/threonine protein kinase
LRITDFGISRTWRENNSEDTSGTPGYMAPEVMNRENHNYLVDYFALGVIAFECMTGRRPYNGRSRKEIHAQTLKKEIQIAENEIPTEYSNEAVDFVN